MDSQQSLPQVSETVVTSEAEDNQVRSASYTESSSINEHVPSIDTYSEQSQNETSNLNIGSDGTLNIKQECSTDSETDLKITGMELPQSGFIQDESLPDGMSTMLDNSKDMSYETSVAMGTSDLQSKHRMPKKNYLTNTLPLMQSAFSDTQTGGYGDQSFKRYKPVSRLTEEEKQRRREMDRERQRRHRERIKAINFMFQN
ncbi:uncharacterized protein LOC132736954 isoform X2 [Ruditapes philippinarum]|uniref:uncharacterized protein LOC132736954 isoform X2 n=1 Tax=Ruditapes philippinarum TaxID=129788 RepID=UPI00295B8079|nr:uncharacterized protein LOC132736954 isoform X2 [Ruditapes philippinarum]